MRSALRWTLPLFAAALLLTSVGRSVRAEDAATAPAGKGTITGTVTKDGKPAAAGLEVRLMKGQMGGQPSTPATQPNDTPPATPGGRPARGMRGVAVATAKTDDQGAFTLSDVPEGSYNIVAGNRANGRGMSKVDVKAGETATVTLDLKAVPAR